MRDLLCALHALVTMLEWLKNIVTGPPLFRRAQHVYSGRSCSVESRGLWSFRVRRIFDPAWESLEIGIHNALCRIVQGRSDCREVEKGVDEIVRLVGPFRV